MCPEGDSVTSVNHYVQHLTLSCSHWMGATSWPGGSGVRGSGLVEDGVFLLSELM